jgi:hypothetical protein
MPAEWITSHQAAALVGCHRNTIDRHVGLGDIERRYPAGKKTPTLKRSSVEEFAEWWRAQELEAERRRQEQEAIPKPGPPDDGEVWLDSATAALVVGVSPQYLGRLALQERLPAARDARLTKWWFRRRDIEQYAASRALRAGR